MSSDVFDLDAARTAQPSMPVRIGGKVYQVVRPLPLKAVLELGAGNFKGSVEATFGAKADAVLEAGISVDDLLAVITAAMTGETPAKAKRTARVPTT